MVAEDYLPSGHVADADVGDTSILEAQGVVTQPNSKCCEVTVPGHSPVLGHGFQVIRGLVSPGLDQAMPPVQLGFISTVVNHLHNEVP